MSTSAFVTLGATLLGGVGAALLSGKDAPEQKKEVSLAQPDPEDPVAKQRNRRKHALASKEGGLQSTLLGGSGSFSKQTL